MKFLKLELEGFGKFNRYTSFNFEEGLNFITGLNETGKSTILEGILASIFKYTPKQIEPFYSWGNPDVCRVSLTYKTDGNELFRITSDYRNNKRRLEKLEIDENILDKEKQIIPIEISTTEKNITKYIKKHFGFDDRKVFENTSFVRQSQMAMLEETSDKTRMKDMIEEVLAGRSEITATKAIKKLHAFCRDKNKKLEELEDDLDKLRRKLLETQNITSNLSQQKVEYERKKKLLEDKQEELRRLEKKKELYSEKEELLQQKESLKNEIRNIDDIVSTIEKNKPVYNQLSLIYIIIGIISISLGILLISSTLIPLILIPLGVILLIYGTIQIFRGKGKPSTLEHQLEEYDRKKRDKINKIAVLDKRLEEYNLVDEFTFEDAEKLDKLRGEVEELNEKVISLKTTINTTVSIIETPEELQEKIENLEEKIEDLREKIIQHEIAAEYLEKAQAEVQQKLTPLVEKETRDILKEITANHYENLKLDEETLDILVLSPEKEEYIDISYLSQGARDQIYFTLRIILVDLLSGNINIPLILDDPFQSFDQERLKRTMNLLKILSKKKQIILISHHPYQEEYRDIGSIITISL